MNCRSCSSTSLQLVIDLGYQPWGNDFQLIENHIFTEKYPLELYFCHNCTLTQLGFTVPKEIMFVSHSYLSGTTRTLRKHFEHVASEIINRFKPSPSCLILDIGGNDGTFLEHFHNLGFRTLNIDSGIAQSQVSIEKGLPTINDFFSLESASKILDSYGTVDIIHAAGILFHLETIHDAFNGIRLLLDKKGILVAEFIYLPTMIEKTQYDQIYHEHLLYYTLTSFKSLLSQHGLEIFDCDFFPIHGGTCIAYISHSNTYSLTRRLKKAFNDEITKKVTHIETMLKFSENVKNSGLALRSIIDHFILEDKTIFALGAPVKGSTLLNYNRIDEKIVPFAVEKNLFKIGTYFPGTKIEVIEEDFVNHPDVYLLLSWNFKDEILSNYADFLKNGGQVINPIPFPEIING